MMIEQINPLAGAMQHTAAMLCSNAAHRKANAMQYAASLHATADTNTLITFEWIKIQS